MLARRFSTSHCALLAACACLAWSAPAIAQVPSAPTNLIATSPQHGQTKLQWQTPASSGSQPITGYEYRQRQDDSAVCQQSESTVWGNWIPIDADKIETDMNTNETIFDVSTQTTTEMPVSEADTIYCFEVRARNSDDSSGEGAASNEATLLPRISLGTYADPQDEDAFTFNINGTLAPSELLITIHFRVDAVGEITGPVTFEGTATWFSGGLGQRPFGEANVATKRGMINPFSNTVHEEDREATIEILPDADGVIDYSPDITASQGALTLKDHDFADMRLFPERQLENNNYLTAEQQGDSNQGTPIGIFIQSGFALPLTCEAYPADCDIIDLTFISNNPSEAKLALNLDDDPVTELTVRDAFNTLSLGADLDQPQSFFLGKIYVIGQDDDVDEPDRTTYTISFTSKSDNSFWDFDENPELPRADGRDTLELTNLDDDTAAVNVALADPARHVTVAGGNTVAFTVALASEPTEEVVVTVKSDAPSEGLVSVGTDAPAEELMLAFDADNWHTSQTVTVTGQSDEADGTGLPYTPFMISFAVASDDPLYDDGVTPAPLQLGNSDAANELAMVANLRLAASPKTLRVLWDEPLNRGARTIDGYSLSWAEAAIPEMEVGSTTVASAARHHDITGLTTGTTYRITITALSTPANGLAATIDGTPTQLPMVADLRLEPGFRQLRVQWNAPLGLEPSIISGYSLSWAEAAMPLERIGSTTVASVVRQHDIMNLDGGTEYAIMLKPLTELGEGTAATATGTPPDDRVTNLRLMAGHQKLRVLWNRPAELEELESIRISGYAVSWATAATPDAEISSATVSVSDTQYDIANLTNGTEYEITIRALTAAGEGTASLRRGTPNANFGPVLDLMVVPADRALQVLWREPFALGGRNLTGYRLGLLRAEGGSFVDFSPPRITYLSVNALTPISGQYYHRFADLDNSRLHSVLVTPLYDANAPNTPDDLEDDTLGMTVIRNFIQPNASVPPLGSVQGLSLTPGPNRITASWNAVTAHGGAPPLRYVVTWGPTGDAAARSSATTADLTYTIADLIGTTITVSVQAVNTLGEFGGEASGAAAPIAPSAVTGLDVVPDNKRLVVSWLAPADSGGAKIVSYTIRWQTGGEPASTVKLSIPPLIPDDRGRYSHIIADLIGDQVYTVGVYASNALGADGPITEDVGIPQAALRLRLRVFLESALP